MLRHLSLPKDDRWRDLLPSGPVPNETLTVGAGVGASRSFARRAELGQRADEFINVLNEVFAPKCMSVSPPHVSAVMCP